MKFEQKISQALSDAAAGVVDHNKKGQVTITFDLKRIETSQQVSVAHKLTYARPTARGKMSEETTTSTPMYVGTNGKLSLFPENQGQLFGKNGEVEKQNESNQ